MMLVRRSETVLRGQLGGPVSRRTGRRHWRGAKQPRQTLRNSRETPDKRRTSTREDKPKVHEAETR
jgi:hypothetical protein